MRSGARSCWMRGATGACETGKAGRQCMWRASAGARAQSTCCSPGTPPRSLALACLRTCPTRAGRTLCLCSERLPELMVRACRDLQARAKDGLGRTPLHVWGYKRCSKAAPGFKSLVLASESAKENADGQTQLHACAGNGGSREQFAYLALSLNGADTADREGGWRKRTAPVVAADAGNEEVVEECVAKSMLGLDALDGSGRQLIDVVCERRLRISSTAIMQAWGSVAGRRWWPCPVSMAFVEAVAANTWWGINTLLQVRFLFALIRVSLSLSFVSFWLPHTNALAVSFISLAVKTFPVLICVHTVCSVRDDVSALAGRVVTVPGSAGSGPRH
eukprot:3001653-Rhodomonas_salina.1